MPGSLPCTIPEYRRETNRLIYLHNIIRFFSCSRHHHTAATTTSASAIAIAAVLVVFRLVRWLRITQTVLLSQNASIYVLHILYVYIFFFVVRSPARSFFQFLFIKIRLAEFFSLYVSLLLADCVAVRCTLISCESAHTYTERRCRHRHHRRRRIFRVRSTHSA